MKPRVSMTCLLLLLLLMVRTAAAQYAHNPANMGEPVGPEMDYANGTACMTTAGILLRNSSQVFISTVEWFRWTPGWGASIPDPVSWHNQLGQSGIPPAVGTYYANSGLINNGWPNPMDSALIATDYAHASPVQWGTWNIPSMYAANPVVGMGVFKVSRGGSSVGKIVATNQKFWATMGPYNGRAPLGNDNLCEMISSIPIWMVNQAAATFSWVSAPDLGASVQQLDGTNCHHPIFVVGCRACPVSVGSTTVNATTGATMATILGSWGLHIAGGNVCEPTGLSDPLIQSPTGRPYVQRVGEIHDPEVKDWVPGLDNMSPKQLAAEADLQRRSAAFDKAHPELPHLLSPAMQAEYEHAGAVGNDPYNECLEWKWHAPKVLDAKTQQHLSDCLGTFVSGGDDIPWYQLGPDVENGRVVMQIVIEGTPTAAQKQIILNDLGGQWSMDGVPVVIHSTNIGAKGAAHR